MFFYITKNISCNSKNGTIPSIYIDLSILFIYLFHLSHPPYLLIHLSTAYETDLLY